MGTASLFSSGTPKAVYLVGHVERCMLIFTVWAANNVTHFNTASKPI